MASDVLNVPLHLIQSALGQKQEVKLSGNPAGERSQGGAAMRRHEVASLRGWMGWPLGRNQGRASPFRAKSALAAPQPPVRRSAHAVSALSLIPVLPAITSGTGIIRFTDEVPRRLHPPGGVRLRYKSQTKGGPHASVTGTASLRPRLEGCQQRQSRSPQWTERQNLRVPGGLGEFMGPVSPAIAATKWLGRTSSFQPAGPAKKQAPTTSRESPLAVLPR